MQSAYTQLTDIFKEIGLLQSISASVKWDYDVMMPKGSAGLKQEQLSFLSALIYQKLNNPKIAELIDKCTILDEWQQANLDLIKKQYIKNTAIDKQLVESLAKASIECEFNWREARKNQDFKLFAKYFKPLLKITQEIAAREADILQLSPYNALLDSYDSGRKSEEIDMIFADLEKFLPELIGKVKEKQNSINITKLSKNFSLAKQNDISLICADSLGFNLNKGRLDLSTHPFSTGFSTDDVRITTRYDKNNLLSGLFAVLHETGHGIYEQNLPKEHAFQPVAKACGMTIHESQSLFVERHIGVTKNFFKWIEPVLFKKFGSYPELKADNLYKISTAIDTSLIRVDADEVTYPAHIIIRYNIEKALLSGDLLVEDLPAVWDEQSLRFFGIKPKNIAHGCLQDIHWTFGAIGYFPTYTLGAMFACQINDVISKKIPIATLIEQGNFKPIIEWLINNIHKNASKLDANSLILHSTNQKLNINIFKKYLQDKYLED